jgi:hypothetical protein
MKISPLIYGLMISMLGAMSLGLLQPASAQIVIERPAAPRSIVRMVILPRTVVSTLPVARSNYVARLAHLQEHLNLGIAKGWLDSGEAAELKNWHGRLVAEEAGLRSTGGGLVPRENTDLMEKNLTGLSAMLTRYMNN